MIGKGKSISHGVAALEYDLAKEINGQAVATEIARHELYGCTGAEMVQEMKPYHIDFPNVKNNCLRSRSALDRGKRHLYGCGLGGTW